MIVQINRTFQRGELLGTKRSLLFLADRGPLAVVIAGANVHDAKLLESTLDAIIVKRPNPKEEEQHLCVDVGVCPRGNRF